VHFQVAKCNYLYDRNDLVIIAHFVGCIVRLLDDDD